MNINSESKIIVKWHWQILSAVCLSVFLFVPTAFAQTPQLRANGKIAFTSTRDGNAEIYVMNPDGTNQIRLTNNPGWDDFPAWSPDGRRLAFVSQNASGGYVIKRMNADGRGQTVITPIVFDTGLFSLSWSPDGSKIAFSESGDIFIINVDGSNRINLTNHPARDYQPSWSPDGTQIAFTSDRSDAMYRTHEIHTMNADGSNVRSFGNQFGYVGWHFSPDWSPDGNRIVYVFSDWGLGTSAASLSVINFSGTDLLFIGDCCMTNPKWSPDNTKLVFYAGEYQNSGIYTKNIDSNDWTRLTPQWNFNPDWQPHPLEPPALAPTFADFDGDGKADISVFRPSDRVWYLNRSQAGFSATQFGLSTDKITPADFDGDGRTDIAVFRDGTWYWLGSSNNNFNAVQFGLADDVPVPADFTGDGRAELAVYRGGSWFTLNLISNQVNVAQFGLSTDKPVVADYDGDGRADFAVYRDGTWYLLQSTLGFAAFQFGLPTDKLVPADYDGDGKTNPAVYRDGTWYLLGSQNGSSTFQFGDASDIPAPADYDGDGRADAAFYRDGVWHLRQSANGFSVQHFGLANDKPVAAAYLP